jgi:hypothetical protein
MRCAAMSSSTSSSSTTESKTEEANGRAKSAAAGEAPIPDEFGGSVPIVCPAYFGDISHTQSSSQMKRETHRYSLTVLPSYHKGLEILHNGVYNKVSAPDRVLVHLIVTGSGFQ